MAGPVPVSSLIAVLLICIGIGLFCGTGYVGAGQVFLAFDASSDGFTFEPGSLPKSANDSTALVSRVKNIIESAQIGIFCLSGFMVVMIIYFLFQAFMATAAIIKDFSSGKVTCGTKGWTTVSVVLSYLLTFLWVLVFAGSGYCFLITFMVSSLDPETTTLDWSVYGLDGGVMTFPDGSQKIFYEYMNQAYIMAAIMFGASFLVLLGMINMSMCHSSNWAHIRTSNYWQKYNDSRRKDELELNTYTNHGASGPVTSTSQVPLNSY